MMLFNKRWRMMLVIAVVAVGAALAQEQTPRIWRRSTTDVSGSKAALAQEPIPAATALPKIAVYAFGAEDPALNKAMATRLIAVLCNGGRYQASEDYKGFFEAAAKEQNGGAASLNSEQITRLGEQFGVKYVCAAEITNILGEKQVSAHILKVETGEIEATGVSDTPLKTSADMTAASEQLVEMMFKSEPQRTYAQTPTAPESPQPVPAPLPEITTSDTPTPAVNVTGEAKIVVDRVVAAVNAFKDATKKSIDAANAVKTAAQSKNFSAIMDAKKKVQSAAEAVKQAKADVTTAIEALKTAGPEAETAVKTLGIDISMFAGKDGDGDEGEGGKVKKTDFYFSPKYQFPVGTPVIWGGVSVEIGWIWENGFLLGIDFDFGYYYEDYYYSNGFSSGYDSYDNTLAGLGFNLGKAYESGSGLQIAWGVALGFWFVSDFGDDYINFLAPFVKLRWNMLELSYRGLLGVDIDYDHSFGYNHHQLMLGFNFQTSRRTKK